MGHVTELLDPVNKKNSIFDRDGRNAKTEKIFTCPKLKWFTKSVASKLEALPIWQTLCQIGRASNFEATDLVNHLSLGQVKM